MSGFLGAGIGYRTPHRAALLRGEGPPLLEVIPDHFFTRPAAMEPLAERYALVFHDVGQSVATDFAGAPDPTTDRLRRIRELTERAAVALFSDHLALIRGPDGHDLGHLAPVWLTERTLATAIERVHRIQDVLRVPVAIENITAGFRIPGGDLDEPEFFCRLVEATGCGVLLDLTNLVINGRNFGFDPLTEMGRYPLQAVVQVHLAGGHQHQGWWEDDHGHPVEDESFALLRALRGKAPLRGIVVERDAHLPPLPKLVAEAAYAQQVWEGM